VRGAAQLRVLFRFGLVRDNTIFVQRHWKPALADGRVKPRSRDGSGRYRGVALVIGTVHRAGALCFNAIIILLLG